MIRWIGLGCAVVGLVWGVLWSLRSGYAFRVAPTAVLFILQGDEDSPVTQELRSRLLKGSLTTEQTQRFIKAAEVPPRFHVRSPHPTSLPVQFVLCFPAVRIDQLGPPPSWNLFHAFHVAVDGKERPEFHYPTSTGPNSITSTPTMTSQIGELSVGTHVVAIQGEFHLTRATQQSLGDAAPLYTWEIDEAVTVEVVDQPVHTLVAPIYTAQLRRRIEKLKLTGLVNARGIDLSFDELPVSIAGQLEVWSERDESFVPWTQISLDRSSSQLNCIYSLGARLPGVASGAVNLRIVPDAAAAFQAGYDEYFGGVIEFRDVRVLSAVSFEKKRVKLCVLPPETAKPGP